MLCDFMFFSFYSYSSQLGALGSQRNTSNDLPLLQNQNPLNSSKSVFLRPDVPVACVGSCRMQSQGLGHFFYVEPYYTTAIEP